VPHAFWRNVAVAAAFVGLLFAIHAMRLAMTTWLIAFAPLVRMYAPSSSNRASKGYQVTRSGCCLGSVRAVP
jgi:hypothetical protein